MIDIFSEQVAIEDVKAVYTASVLGSVDEYVQQNIYTQPSDYEGFEKQAEFIVRQLFNAGKIVEMRSAEPAIEWKSIETSDNWLDMTNGQQFRLDDDGNRIYAQGKGGQAIQDILQHIQQNQASGGLKTPFNNAIADAREAGAAALETVQKLGKNLSSRNSPNNRL
ncbi:MAG: hypothetical protein ACOYK8_09235 [Alphaproteobacteria bacterium]